MSAGAGITLKGRPITTWLPCTLLQLSAVQEAVLPYTTLASTALGQTKTALFRV